MHPIADPVPQPPLRSIVSNGAQGDRTPPKSRDGLPRQDLSDGRVKCQVSTIRTPFQHSPDFLHRQVMEGVNCGCAQLPKFRQVQTQPADSPSGAWSGEACATSQWSRGWHAGAFKLKARDRWIGWLPEQQFRRLHLIANNARFLILPGCAAANLASRVLGLSLRRLSAPTSPSIRENMSPLPVYLNRRSQPSSRGEINSSSSNQLPFRCPQ